MQECRKLVIHYQRATKRIPKVTVHNLPQCENCSNWRISQWIFKKKISRKEIKIMKTLFDQSEYLEIIIYNHVTYLLENLRRNQYNTYYTKQVKKSPKKEVIIYSRLKKRYQIENKHNNRSLLHPTVNGNFIDTKMH